MTNHLEPDILAASQPLQLPGSGEQRVLSPIAVARLAELSREPRWTVEALALEAGVIPLHYLRNLARFGRDGQIRLLRAEATLVGCGPVIERIVEQLAQSGVGTLRVLVPVTAGVDADVETILGRVRGLAANRNASCVLEGGSVSLRGGNPAQSFRGAPVAACLLDSMDEQLLQFACRVARAPLVLGGVEGSCGQATTVLPGDAGTALIYRPSHPHLEPKREKSEVDPRAAMMVGTWLAEQLLHLLLEDGELLRGRLLYADLYHGEMAEYPL